MRELNTTNKQKTSEKLSEELSLYIVREVHSTFEEKRVFQYDIMHNL